MDILPIYPKNSPAIYSVRFEGQSQDEFSRMFTLWKDVEYLESFFDEHTVDLCGGHFGCLSIEDAVERTLDDAGFLEERLLYPAVRSNSPTGWKSGSTLLMNS